MEVHKNIHVLQNGLEAGIRNRGSSKDSFCAKFPLQNAELHYHVSLKLPLNAAYAYVRHRDV